MELDAEIDVKCCETGRIQKFRNRSQQTQTRLQSKQFPTLDFIFLLQGLIRNSPNQLSHEVRRIWALRDRFRASYR